MPTNKAGKKLTEFKTKKEAYMTHKEPDQFIDSKKALLEENGNMSIIQKQDRNFEILSGNGLNDEALDEDTSLTLFDYVYYTLWFFLWATVYAIFIKLEFGTIYLIVSGIIGMYLNTRTGPKKKNEISAYSVFNRNCESIDGTLKGEQLTREMIYGGFR